MIGIAAPLACPLFHIVVKRDAIVQRGLGCKNSVGIPCTNRLTLIRPTRLHNHRTTLGRAWHVQGPAHGEVLAAIGNLMHFGWVCKYAARGIRLNRIVFPAVPQLNDDVGEFRRTLIAHCVDFRAIKPEVLRCRIAVGRYQVPGCTATADVVDRRQAPRQIERLVIGRRSRRYHTDMLGRSRYGGQQNGRL